MSKFFVGQRVRKVRGKTNVGHTGTIIGIDPFCPLKLNLHIRVDCACVGFRGLARDVEPVSAGSDGWGNPDLYEPILDQHEPCEPEFKASLDKLLEGLPA